MTETGAEPGGSDAVLGADLRRPGDAGAALDELYRRHFAGVLAYARTCCRDPYTAEDLASEAFTRTVEAVRAGGGPGAAWRPYLLTVVRRTAAEWARTARRTELAPDFERWLGSSGGPGPGPMESGEERVLREEDDGMVRRAFLSLPQRWQLVLWHAEVEGESAARIAPMLGIGASGVGSLAARAREGLRAAYLTEHLSAARPQCARYAVLIGADVRQPRRERRLLARHLATCAECRRARADLSGIDRRMRAVLPAALLLWAGPFTGAAGLHLVVGAAGGAGAGAAAGGALAVGSASGPLAAGAAAVGTAAVVGGAAVLGAVPAPGPGPGAPEASAPQGFAGPSAVPGEASAPPDGAVQEYSDDGAEEAGLRELGEDIGPVRGTTRLTEPGTGACVLPEGAGAVLAACDGADDEFWETFTAPGGSVTWLRNAATGGCLDYGAPDGGAPEDGSADGAAEDAAGPAPAPGASPGPESSAAAAVAHGPCRSDRHGQMFRFLVHPDGGYSVLAGEDAQGGISLLVTAASAPLAGPGPAPPSGSPAAGVPAEPSEGAPLVTVASRVDGAAPRFLLSDPPADPSPSRTP
ncbi:sigma-70 family RNA polymerase sigma factor [Nocardiopsis coralliicola]